MKAASFRENPVFGAEPVIASLQELDGSVDTDRDTKLPHVSLRKRGGADHNPAGETLKRTLTAGVTVDAANDLADVVSLVRACLAQRARLLVTFVNPSSRAVMRCRADYRRQLELVDLILPDGVGMSLAVRWLHGIAAARISFDMTSLAVPVMQIAEEGGYRVALVGGAPGRAERAFARLQEGFPDLNGVGCFDGYGEIKMRAYEIAATGADIVICGMGAGVQEEMLLELARAGWRGCGFTCGGFLDQLGDRLNYYPRWVDRFHLRWAYRLVMEPRRLWRRYLLTYPEFLIVLIWELLMALFRAPMRAFDAASARAGHEGLVEARVDDTSTAGRL